MSKNTHMKSGALLLAVILIGGFASMPVIAMMTPEANRLSEISSNETVDWTAPGSWEYAEEAPNQLDVPYDPEPVNLLTGEFTDIGYNVDAGDDVRRALPVYLGEPIEETIPGRGRTGLLDTSRNDKTDWYSFSACAGQSFQGSTTGGFSCQFADSAGQSTGQSLAVTTTGRYFFNVYTAGDGGEYTFTITASGQNDAGSGSDAGNDAAGATSIIPGTYTGYMSYQDVEDWYSFTAASGDGIFVTIEPYDDSDFDLHLYNPSGVKVTSAQFYGGDTLEYPADVSGTWVLKIDIFPGWDTSKWPENYFLYGSGAYDLELTIGGNAEAPVGPIAQPDIIPVAQTFIVNDDPDSNKDEYGYLAAVPAANYVKNGQRYVSPIVYQGVDTITHWFGTVDDTTQYLLDDWNTYLGRHDVVAEEFIIPGDPITAAKAIALANWASSDTAVVVCDGSAFEDETVSVLDETATLSSSPEITRIQPGGFTVLGSDSVKIMNIGSKYGAIHLIAKGDAFSGDTAIITPRYERVQDDNWPFPYDQNGPDMDSWYPITKPGIWMPFVTSESGLEELEIVKYPGDRYTIPVDASDASIEISLETDEPSRLMVYLIDPEGNIRRPTVPEWNGGEVQPLHTWNGGHWQHNFDDYRRTIIEPATQRQETIHYAMAGDWTAIVVPYIDQETGYAEFSGSYHLTVNLRTYNADRVNAEMSAANGAVLASVNHAPLLYVTADAVPADTASVLTSLGVSKIIFVNIGDISSAALPGTVTEYTSMAQVVDAIKASSLSENFITITSSGTGDGYFAPSAMIAAYHGGPVLNMGEAKEAYNILDITTNWREWAGEAYHGARTNAHLAQMDHPSELPNPPSWLQVLIYYLTHEKEMPHTGLDMELTWFTAIHDGIYNWINAYGLDGAGQEAYMFVSPRDTDIQDLAVRAMLGNNSYAGHILFETPAMSTAHICRDILYSAIIYANPGRDVTSGCFMNFRNGHTWECNDGNDYADFITQKMKQFGFSHGRTYEGNTLWSNILERYNTGTSLMWHCSHGTGGSGICCMFENVEEQFPLAEVTHEHLKDFRWWDGWRGYLYDNLRTPTPRQEGLVWFNSEEPNLYDIIHFKWCDQLFTNLHSQFNCWMSCTTGSDFGPDIYLEHGAALWYGNGNTGLSPQEEVLDQWIIEDTLNEGISIGQATASYIWLHQRDYTTMDPTTIYGTSSLQICSEQMIMGDPTMVIYSPEWIEPVPITP